MPQEAWMVSMVLLWLVVIVLVVVILALARHIGILYERVAPMGALVIDHGPKVGEVAPAFALIGLDKRQILIAHQTGKAQLLFFLSPTCPVCKKLLPAIRAIQKAEEKWLDVVLASDGEFAVHQAFYERAALAPFPYVLSTELGMSYKIGRLPYCILIGSDQRVRGKGLVNSREQIESLFTAQETGVASVQEYLAGSAGSAVHPQGENHEMVR